MMHDSPSTDLLILRYLEGAMSSVDFSDFERLVQSDARIRLALIETCENIQMVKYVLAGEQAESADPARDGGDDADILLEALELERQAVAQRELDRVLQGVRRDAELAEKAAHQQRLQTMFGLNHEPIEPVRHVVIPKAVFYSAIAAVAAVLIMLAYPYFQQPETPAPPSIADSSVNEQPAVAPIVATLINTQDAQWEDAFGGGQAAFLERGDDLRAGRLLLRQGVVELAMRRGTTVILEAPCEVDLMHESELFLRNGKLAATVARQDQRFTVRTPTADVVDFGTQFGVRVHLDGGTDAAVFEGKVELREKQDDDASTEPSRFQALRAGWSSSVDHQGRLNRDATPLWEKAGDHFIRSWDEVGQTPRVSGAVRYVQFPPTDLSIGAYEHDDWIALIRERQNVVLPRKVQTALIGPGERDVYTDQAGYMLPPGMRVDSYLLQFDPTGIAPKQIQGAVTFPRRIVGVVAHSGPISRTHSMFGLDGVSYESELIGYQGLEGRVTQSQPSRPDVVRIHPDGRTLSLKFLAKDKGIDAIRVLIEPAR